MAGEGVVCFSISKESTNGAAPKCFALRQGEDKAIRIGRAPGNDILVEHRGVSQYHAEVRLSSDGELCVRDLSMNGTGLKRPDSETPSTCQKNSDENLPNDASILVPMLLKAGGERSWLRVRILEGDEATKAQAEAKARGPPTKARTSVKPAAPKAAAVEGSDGSEEEGEKEEDTEKARVRFVELLLKTREVNATTSYEDARRLLSSEAAWDAVDESTRKECFEIFVEHLGAHANQKKDKKKDKGKKKKKEAAEDEDGAGKKEKKRKRGGGDDDEERGKKRKKGGERRSESGERGRRRGRGRHERSGSG